MGRIFCPDCVLEVDEIDGQCPYCGYVFSPKEREEFAVKDTSVPSKSTGEGSNIGCGCGLIIGIFFLIFIFISLLSCGC